MCSPSNTTPQQHFNTSRELKATHNTSTIDSAYLPKLFEEDLIEPAAIRVPILPHIESDAAEAVLAANPHLDAAAGGYQDTEAHRTQMKAEIAVPDDANSDNVSVMSDVHDGHHPGEMTVEMLTQLSETVGNSARKFVDMVKDKDEATIRKIWTGFLDDLFGQKQAKL